MTKMREAKWTQKFINDLPDSAFLYIKPDGKKDSDGKTEPRASRMFPYKNADGNVDLPHLRNALSRIPQADISQSIKDRLSSKARKELEAITEESAVDELEELELAQPVAYSVAMGATSFADLDTATDVEESLLEVNRRTYQLQDIIFNIMNDPATESKVKAIGLATDEYVALIEDILDTPEQIDAGESGNFAEFDAEFPVSIVGLSEGERDGRQVVYIDFVPIMPGWGNKRDNHYYPRDVVAEAMPVWGGAKMYATDHKEDQKSVLTEVSQVVESPAGVTDDGLPYATAVILSKTFEEIARRRNAAGLLKDLHCSILASGVAKPGFELDGREGKLVESITQVQSIDWVTRAGAGGHAIGLSESEAEVNEQEKLEQEQDKIQEGEGEPVTLREEDGEQESEKLDEGKQDGVDNLESGNLEYLTEIAVTALLPQHMPQVAKDKLLARQFVSEADAKHAILLEVDYLKAVTGSGNPVGGQSVMQQRQPVITQTELTEQKDAVNNKWMGG